MASSSNSWVSSMPSCSPATKASFSGFYQTQQGTLTSKSPSYVCKFCGELTSSRKNLSWHQQNDCDAGLVDCSPGCVDAPQVIPSLAELSAYLPRLVPEDVESSSTLSGCNSNSSEPFLRPLQKVDECWLSAGLEASGADERYCGLDDGIGLSDDELVAEIMGPVKVQDNLRRSKLIGPLPCWSVINHYRRLNDAAKSRAASYKKYQRDKIVSARRERSRLVKVNKAKMTKPAVIKPAGRGHARRRVPKCGARPQRKHPGPMPKEKVAVVPFIRDMTYNNQALFRLRRRIAQCVVARSNVKALLNSASVIEALVNGENPYRWTIPFTLSLPNFRRSLHARRVKSMRAHFARGLTNYLLLALAGDVESNPGPPSLDRHLDFSSGSEGGQTQGEASVLSSAQAPIIPSLNNVQMVVTQMPFYVTSPDVNNALGMATYPRPAYRTGLLGRNVATGSLSFLGDRWFREGENQLPQEFNKRDYLSMVGIPHANWARYLATDPDAELCTQTAWKESRDMDLTPRQDDRPILRDYAPVADLLASGGEMFVNSKEWETLESVLSSSRLFGHRGWTSDKPAWDEWRFGAPERMRWFARMANLHNKGASYVNRFFALWQMYFTTRIMNDISVDCPTFPPAAARTPVLWDGGVAAGARRYCDIVHLDGKRERVRNEGGMRSNTEVHLLRHNYLVPAQRRVANECPAVWDTWTAPAAPAWAGMAGNVLMQGYYFKNELLAGDWCVILPDPGNANINNRTAAQRVVNWLTSPTIFVANAVLLHPLTGNFLASTLAAKPSLDDVIFPLANLGALDVVGGERALHDEETLEGLLDGTVGLYDVEGWSKIEVQALVLSCTYKYWNVSHEVKRLVGDANAWAIPHIDRFRPLAHRKVLLHWGRSTPITTDLDTIPHILNSFCGLVNAAGDRPWNMHANVFTGVIENLLIKTGAYDDCLAAFELVAARVFARSNFSVPGGAAQGVSDYTLNAMMEGNRFNLPHDLTATAYFTPMKLQKAAIPDGELATILYREWDDMVNYCYYLNVGIAKAYSWAFTGLSLTNRCFATGATQRRKNHMRRLTYTSHPLESSLIDAYARNTCAWLHKWSFSKLLALSIHAPRSVFDAAGAMVNTLAHSMQAFCSFKIIDFWAVAWMLRVVPDMAMIPVKELNRKWQESEPGPGGDLTMNNHDPRLGASLPPLSYRMILSDGGHILSANYYLAANACPTSVVRENMQWDNINENRAAVRDRVAFAWWLKPSNIGHPVGANYHQFGIGQYRMRGYAGLGPVSYNCVPNRDIEMVRPRAWGVVATDGAGVPAPGVYDSWVRVNDGELATPTLTYVGPSWGRNEGDFFDDYYVTSVVDEQTSTVLGLSFGPVSGLSDWFSRAKASVTTNKFNNLSLLQPSALANDNEPHIPKGVPLPDFLNMHGGKNERRTFNGKSVHLVSRRDDDHIAGASTASSSPVEVKLSTKPGAIHVRPSVKQTSVHNDRILEGNDKRVTRPTTVTARVPGLRDIVHDPLLDTLPSGAKPTHLPVPMSAPGGQVKVKVTKGGGNLNSRSDLNLKSAKGRVEARPPVVTRAEATTAHVFEDVLRDPAVVEAAFNKSGLDNIIYKAGETYLVDKTGEIKLTGEAADLARSKMRSSNWGASHRGTSMYPTTVQDVKEDLAGLVISDPTNKLDEKVALNDQDAYIAQNDFVKLVTRSKGGDDLATSATKPTYSQALTSAGPSTLPKDIGPIAGDEVGDLDRYAANASF